MGRVQMGVGTRGAPHAPPPPFPLPLHYHRPNRRQLTWWYSGGGRKGPGPYPQPLHLRTADTENTFWNTESNEDRGGPGAGGATGGKANLTHCGPLQIPCYPGLWGALYPPYVHPLLAFGLVVNPPLDVPCPVFRTAYSQPRIEPRGGWAGKRDAEREGRTRDSEVEAPQPPSPVQTPRAVVAVLHVSRHHILSSSRTPFPFCSGQPLAREHATTVAMSPPPCPWLLGGATSDTAAAP